jgi:hypothetical protein
VVKTVKETEVLDMAQRETDKMLDRTGLRHLLIPRDGFWGKSKY